MKKRSKETASSSKPALIPGFKHIHSAGGIHEYLFKANGLRVLYLNRKGTGVVTTNITYFVGSKDEPRQRTGVAHMLEHMLFKPTIHDIKRGTDASSMLFEKETGCVLNANTWKDRTTYYFSYPVEHFSRAIQIEAERMTGVILTDESLSPERNNVLSEHDMYNGDPYFALNVAMVSSAYYSHPYGHETIGHREDIEQYDAVSLDQFYRSYYRPDNAVMMVIGDVDEKTTLATVKKHFGVIERPQGPIPRYTISEPKQEGLRRVHIERPSELNVISFGIKAPAFPSPEWYDVSALFEVLTSGPESILHRAFVDTGIATGVDGSLEPTKEENLASITITATEGVTLESIEEKFFSLIDSLDAKEVASLLKKVKAKMLTDELFARDSSLRIAAELTEYSSAGDWTLYTKTPHILETITVKNVLASVKLFDKKTMTIGCFIGTNA